MSSPTTNGTRHTDINPSIFIEQHLTPFAEQPVFLVGPSQKTQSLWTICQDLLQQERAREGVHSVDPDTISTITSHAPGYIHQPLETIVGLQTDAPLKRAIKPFGGWRTAEKACEAYGYTLNPLVRETCQKHRKTHNDGVFDVYTEEMRAYRRHGVITGLPDNYARGRIIGDYRRVPLYGTTRLITEKEQDKAGLTFTNEADIRLTEELAEQIRALSDMEQMAAGYGFDIRLPAQNAHEAVQWLYFAYLAAIKEQDGAAMSLGNITGFLDIFIERDLAQGHITEEDAQELIDQLVIKLRLVRHLRTPDYAQLFAGDPTWITIALAGTLQNGESRVCKTDYRFLQTLYNLGPSPEPNLTILWSQKLPEAFKRFCAKVSIDTSAIQFENDDLMSCVRGVHDYGISCCVSMLESGKEMQFFGARCNLPKILLLALNAGRDEHTGTLLVPNITPLTHGPLDIHEVEKRLAQTLQHVMAVYAQMMNAIHFMHDKYFYEKAQMALLDSHLKRIMAFGIAGLSTFADSLSAITYATVTAIHNEQGLTHTFSIDDSFPAYGNDDARADQIAVNIVQQIHDLLSKHPLYRHARPTLSALTITSNVMYGQKTGATPDGRAAGEPFAPGANPYHNRDTHGIIASLNSVAKLPWDQLQDGISNTVTFTPLSLGNDNEVRVRNLTSLIDGYMEKKGHHLNINVLDRSLLEQAMRHPEHYPSLTIRVSGYAVHFVKLSHEHQLEILARTFHAQL